MSVHGGDHVAGTDPGGRRAGAAQHANHERARRRRGDRDGRRGVRLGGDAARGGGRDSRARSGASFLLLLRNKETGGVRSHHDPEEAADTEADSPAGAVCGVAFSSVPRSGKSASAVVTPIVLVLQFVSGVFFQFDQLPTWMQDVAAVFPLKWMAQGMRSVFLPDEAAGVLEPSGSWQHGATAAVLVAYLVVGLVAGARTFRWLRRDEGE